ncbi:MAG: FAD binding domain-containing protein [Myxococcota bacterium]
MLPNFATVRPKGLKEASRHLVEREDAHLHAGGTDLLGCLHDGVFDASLVVSLGALRDDLRGIERTSDGGLRIGAMTTIAEVADHEDVRTRYRALADAASVVASPQLRNQGTLGGNLCQKPRCWYYRGDFPCLRKGGSRCYAINGQNQFHCIFGGTACYIVHPSDPAPALVALDAKVEIAGPKGRRTLPVADLHVPPSEDPMREVALEDGEILTSVVLPPPPEGLRSSYRKIRARASWDFALAGVALALQMDGETVKDCRVVLGGAAPVPWRSKPVEEVLRGAAIDDATVARARKAVIRGARPLEHNGYKLPLFQGLVEDELRAIAGT